ncbi:peptide/nickel transport system permease protein [Jatrophihabitans sp. GAS493]|uniref:ABC transporter permease n=1 Tax=Jatrophihabitans sp. GAS493 TaxID=1907575 RepID=UPI000BB6E0A6|nr:ABC transporter permease [Jatrophihabitans sp. GAS493]SOD74237.1 peptide/nickel transport system permease protein [Jatrophihabitans sp. GAS493]
MTTLIAKRLASMIVIIIVLSAIVFYLQHISPLDPVHAQLGGQASQEAVAQERHKLGLDEPVINQYWNYLTGLLHGDMGTSYRTRRPVSTDLAEYLPATIELAAAGMAIALVLAALFAFGSVLRWPGSSFFRMILMVGASSPAFLLGILGILLFYSKLGWLPASGRTDISDAPTGPTRLLLVDSVLHGRFDVFVDGLQHLILPATAIALIPAVAIGRVLRSSLITELRSDYARTGRAKGLSEMGLLVKHILRNSVGAALSMTGLQIGLMFAGVLVIEQVFAWPGIGLYVAESIPVADFPAIAGVTLLLGVGYVIINTIVDLLQGAADPRIRV